MNRFFIQPQQVDHNKKEICIYGDDVKHISKVLRLSPGDFIEVCDGAVYQYVCSIKEITKDMVTVKYTEKSLIMTEAPIKVILYQGIPKATKMDLIIQKTTEMGIAEIVPIITDRTVVKLDSKKDEEKKVERWQKIAEEAAKQSKRGVIPKIHPPISFKEAIINSKTYYNIMAYEKETSQGLRGVLKELKHPTPPLAIWIGPEGGYSHLEIEKALAAGIKTIGLGPRILRTETAGFALLSMIMFQLGDLGGC